MTELDGYGVRVIPLPMKSDGRVFESPSYQAWTTYPAGLLEFENGAWVKRPDREIGATIRAALGGVYPEIPMYPVRKGRVLYLLPEGLMEYSVGGMASSRGLRLHSASQGRIGTFLGMAGAPDGGLWITGTLGLARVAGPGREIKAESTWTEFLPPSGFPGRNLRQPIADPDGGVTVVLDNPGGNPARFAARFDGLRWSLIPDLPNSAGPLRMAWRGPLGSTWVATSESLFQLDSKSGKMVENLDVPARKYFDVATEPGGAFWLATFDGLLRYAPLTWRNAESAGTAAYPVLGITEDGFRRVWFLGTNSLHLVHNEEWSEIPFPEALSRNLQSARNLFPLENGDLLLEGADAVCRFRPGNQEFTLLSTNRGPNSFKPLGLLKDGGLCVAVRDPASAGGYHLQDFDGEKFRPAPIADFNADLGQLVRVFATQNGDTWVSGTTGMALLHDRRWKIFRQLDGAPMEATTFLDFPSGKTWFANREAIMQFDGQNWSVIRSGFLQITAMVRTADGGAWVASIGGLFRNFQGGWIENGAEEGLPAADINEIFQDRDGNLWAATSRGLSLYHPEADPDPPKTIVENLSGDQKEIPAGSLVTFNIRGEDKWKFTPRERLLFSYRLDENDWTPFQELNSISLPDLFAGKHVFQVRAVDRNCNVDPRPARLEFSISLPWYEETRLISISIAGVAAVVFFAGLAFNRHRQLVRSYAEVEKKVAERTRQLEIASQELLQSQKMNALGTIAAGIAHDFNNILSIIKGSAQIIEDNLDNPEKIHKRLDRIKTVVEQGSGIVKAMLGFGRGGDLQPGPIHLNTVVSDTVQLLGDRFLRQVEIRLQHADVLPEVVGARDLIQQVLLNFLFNASEAVTERKEIILSTSQTTQLPGGIVLAPPVAPVYVVATVQDFGCGIAPENLSRIFEPFFTTKALSTRRGTGLGLSMVYELAKKMNAGLAVESVLNQGSRFSLILPVAPV